MKKDNLVNFLKIKNVTDDKADLYFYGDIVSSWIGAVENTDQYPDSVRDFLKEHEGKNLNIFINSGGGSVFAGIAIYNMLKRHKGHKTVHVDGLAGSIASVIALAGDKVVIPANAYMMIHEPWCGAIGTSSDLRKQADLLDNIKDTILNVYAENLAEGVSIDTIGKMVEEETWLNGLDCAKYFNVEVADEVNAVACVSEYFDKYNKVPETIKNEEVIEEKVIDLDYYKSKLKMYELR